MPFLGSAHWYDLLPLILVVLLFFGPKRLPEMGASIGKTIKELQKSMHEVSSSGAVCHEPAPFLSAEVTEIRAPAEVPVIAAPSTSVNEPPEGPSPVA